MMPEASGGGRPAAAEDGGHRGRRRLAAAGCRPLPVAGGCRMPAVARGRRRLEASGCQLPDAGLPEAGWSEAGRLAECRRSEAGGQRPGGRRRPEARGQQPDACGQKEHITVWRGCLFISGGQLALHARMAWHGPLRKQGAHNSKLRVSIHMLTEVSDVWLPYICHGP